MPTTIKGQLACPECKTPQAVKYDGRKFFINCAECRTLTHYQAKAAQARIRERLALHSQPEADVTITSPKLPAKAPPTPANTGSFFDHLDDLF